MKCLSLTILVWGFVLANITAQMSTNSDKKALNRASQNASNTSIAAQQLVSSSTTTALPTRTTVFNTGTLPVVSFTTTNVSCNGLADGCATAVVSGNTGNLGYLWSNGATTSNICGLGPGTYTVTVTDTILAGTPTLDTVYFENFEATHNWNLAVSTGTSGTTPNVWAVNDSEGGVAPTGCGVGNNGDNTMHITCTSLFCGSLITGAVYNATEESNVRAESPIFSTVGYNTITFTFDYIANGDGLNDNASLLYNDGSGWQVLDPSLKSPVCVTGQGEWTAYSITLPASCDNNPTVQIGFNWTNNADNIGTDPSIAVNNTLLTSMGTGSSTQICTVINDTTIVQPLTLVLNVDTVAPVVCAGNNNGFINTTTSGGTAPYTYNWSNGAMTANIANLADSTYYVTLTDTNGCVVMDSADITTLGLIQVTLDSTTDISCNGDSTGAIYTSVLTDTTGNNCTSSIVAINEFLYNPLIRDGQNPYTGEYIELIGPAGADISCYVLTDGDWTITLPAGSIIPPDGFFTIGNDSIWGTGTFDLDAENCNCFTDGTNAGLLILTTGGEYVALYDNTGTFLEGVIYGNPTTTGNNFPIPGTVMNTIGAPGCPASVTIPSVAAFETAPGGVADDVSLSRDPDGSGAWIPQIGGSLGACNNSNANSGGNNATYVWSNGDTTQNISNLPAGTYTVTATNTYGCTTTATYTLTEPTALSATTLATNIACVGDTTGAIDLTVTGGTMPYTFNWSNGAVTEDLGMLLSGNYCVTVTDNNGCTIITCDTITEPFFTIPVDTFYICAGNSVQIEVNTNATTINWMPAGSLSNDTIVNPFASPISTTTYIVTTTGSCTTMDSIVVIVDSVRINFATVNPLCNGDTTGSITTTVLGSNYNYLWNTGDTTTSLTNVGAGTYMLTVSSGSCQDIDSIVLTEPTAIALSLSSSTDPSCNGDSTGAIAITNTGGTVPYTYSWTNTATTQNLNNLPAGLYNLTLTDNNGCTAPFSVTLTEPSAISVSYNSTNVSCGGLNDGSASVTPTGGTAGYTYLWDVAAGSQTTATATNLMASTYSVTITDLVGCMVEANGIFVYPGVPVDSNDVPLAVLTGMLDCELNPVGALEINTANTYTYLWSNGSTNRSITNLPAGTYSVTVTNGLGCNHVQTATINSPFVPIVNPFIVNLGLTTTTVTSGALVDINGGNDQSSQGVTYNWTSSNIDVDITVPTTHTTNAMSTVTGSYVLTLTATANDNTACQDTGSVILNVESVYTGMPTAFTPNEDGINDLYRPTGLNEDDIVTFRVYNRWGQEVYNGDDLENKGWDGRFQGVEQPTEVYLFVLEYKLGVNSESKVRKGEFSLIR